MTASGQNSSVLKVSGATRFFFDSTPRSHTDGRLQQKTIVCTNKVRHHLTKIWTLHAYERADSYSTPLMFDEKRTPVATGVTQSVEMCCKEKYLALVRIRVLAARRGQSVTRVQIHGSANNATDSTAVVRIAVPLLNGKIRNANGIPTNHVSCDNTDNYRCYHTTRCENQPKDNNRKSMNPTLSCNSTAAVICTTQFSIKNVNFTHRRQFYGSLWLTE